MRATILMLKRNLQNKKMYSFVIMILTIISTLCLVSALGIISRTGELYDEAIIETNSPQILMAFEKNQYNEIYKEELEQKENVLKINEVPYYYSTFRFKNEDKLGVFFVEWKPTENNYKTRYLTDVSLQENEILLPSSMENDFDLHINDLIEFKLGDGVKTYVVKDFIEDPFFGSSISTTKRIYASPKQIQQFSERSDILSYKTLSIYLEQDSIDQKSIDTILSSFSNHSNVAWSVDQLMLKNASTLIPSLLAFMFIIFSLFLFIITILILRYSVIETIESEYTKLGVMKALGFSNNELVIGVILQYQILSLIGCIVGSLVGIFITPYIGHIILDLTGIWWSGGVAISIILFVIIAINVFILFLLFINTRKMTAISPTKAIALGKNNSYKPKFLDIGIERMTFLPLNLRISLKQIMTKTKQYTSIIVISTMFSFLILSMGALSDFFRNQEEMVTFLGFDSSDIQIADSNFTVKSEDMANLIKEIELNYTVSDAISFQSQKSNINGRNVTALIYDDFTEKNINMIQGNIPKNENEISITPTLQKTLNLEVGDTVKIQGKENTEIIYVIVGIHQSIEDMGNNFKISTSNYLLINSDFQPTMIKLYLEDIDVNQKQSLIDTYKDYKSNIIVSDGSKAFIDIVNTIQIGLLSGTITMLVVSMLMIALSALLLTTVTLVREKNDNGIMKSIGYTTNQLKVQLCYRFLLSSLAGVAMGTLLAATLSNGLFTALFQNLGVAKITLYWSSYLIVSICFFICFCSTAISFLVANKINLISPKDLVRD